MCQATHIDELILVAWAWATHVLMMLKNNIAEYRPVQRSALVMPIIATPGHGSLPSGHATIAAMTAHLLAALLNDPAAAAAAAATRENLLHRLASRIAFNRVVAGVHFPMDSYVGERLGGCLAQAFVAMAKSRSEMPAAACVIQVQPNSQWVEGQQSALWSGEAELVPSLPSLEAMWSAASKELETFRI